MSNTVHTACTVRSKTTLIFVIQYPCFRPTYFLYTIKEIFHHVKANNLQILNDKMVLENVVDFMALQQDI